jgi:Uma2 family endonuclease
MLEFDDGYIEVLPMPIPEHQKILALLYELFVAFVRPRGGVTLFSPLRVRIRPRKFREPDLVVLQDANDPRQHKRYWLGADLAVDYAEAGIPEYWIVNPLEDTITVLVLEGDAYAEHGVFRRGEHATSRLLAGFSVDVNEVFNAK